MNFEKIEMIGFKSFADKVEIVFDNGVTGIVGPNGCGKSNIADAIRWVLGEQSAKTMRGSSMTDVIFNGTVNRKALSYCEVSLYFDNSNHIFKSSEYSEVILTRKLFRSGESEYLVNKQPARLMDIVSLLHECGVSKNGYSIIGQGKVSEILSSKPEDRRSIFEEAIGIAQAKSKKLETERKLERTHDNLLRVLDITTELERTLGPAERAAEKTKKFLDLSAELKYHEINNYLYKYDSSSVIKEKINLRIKGIEEESVLRAGELKEAENAYEQHTQERDAADKIIEELHNEILLKSVSQEKLSGDTKLYNEKISFFRSEIERLTNEISEKEEKIELLDKAVKSKEEYLDQCRADLEKTKDKQKALGGELTKVLGEISNDEAAQQSAQSEVLKAADVLLDFSKNMGSLNTEKSVLSTQQQEKLDKINALTVARQQFDSEKARLEKEITENEDEQKTIAKQITATEVEISATNNRISELANKLYNLNIELNSLETNRKIYANLKDSFDGYPTSVKRLMLSAKENAKLNSKIKGVVASLIKTDRKYEVAIETALGNAVQHVVTATPEDAQYLIEYLKKCEGGRVTFLPVSNVKPHLDGPEITSALGENGVLGFATELVTYDGYYENVVRFLLGNTLVVDNIASAVAIAKKHAFSFKIVTLDGDIVNPSGSMTGGSRRQNQMNVLSPERMVDDLTEQIKAKTAEIEKLSNEKESATTRSNAYVDTLNELNDSAQNNKLAYTSLNEKLSSIELLIEQNEKELNENKEFIDTITSRIEKISEEFSTIEEGNKKLVNEKETASTNALKHQTDYEAKKDQRDKITNEISTLRSTESSLNSEINSTVNDIARMNGEIEDAKAIIEKDNEGIVTDNGIIEGFFKEIEKLTLDAEETSGIKELRDKLDYYSDQKEKLTTAISQDDLKRQMLNSEINKLGERKHNEELAITKIDSDLEYMQKRVEEEYNETYETCVPMRDPDYDVTVSNEEITKLKHRIAGLGTINPNAIEEYRIQSERYNELLTQKEDIEKAEEDLRQVLKSIIDEMLSKFNEGFEQIRGHFKRIFKELFGGGTADLILDYSNAEDPLMAGVEIVAEPPGKKLQKISLLSGGEMSLTAIAILFAILRLRPMPFCVLDEIEAALDDANVERFARYLKRFSDETQFIVITHKKVTMELSDALFGVTMQEKGVSKIVSVKLSDINENLAD